MILAGAIMEMANIWINTRNLRCIKDKNIRHIYIKIVSYASILHWATEVRLATRREQMAPL